MRNVTSSDPRKPAIVAGLKRLSGATKITMLREDDTHWHARGLRYDYRTDAWVRVGRIEWAKDASTFAVYAEA